MEETNSMPMASAGGMKRPWQGTALGVIDIIAVVFAFLFGLLFLFMQGFISSILGSGDVVVEGVDGAAATGLMGMLAGFAMVIGVVLLLIGVLEIFMARGAFKGQKWSPITSIVLAGLAIAGMVTNFDNSQIFGLVVDVFILYLSVMCVKSPFYNKPKV